MQEQTEMTTPVDLGNTWILTLISKETLLVDIYLTTFWKWFGYNFFYNVNLLKLTLMA